MYGFKLHAFNQPFLELYRYSTAENVLVGNDENVLIGDAHSSSSTSEIRLTLSGHEYTLTP